MTLNRKKYGKKEPYLGKKEQGCGLEKYSPHPQFPLSPGHAQFFKKKNTIKQKGNRLIET